MARSLDGSGELLLILPARTGNTTRQDFPLLVYKIEQKVGVFVIYISYAAFFEEAELFPLTNPRQDRQSGIRRGWTYAFLYAHASVEIWDRIFS